MGNQAPGNTGHGAKSFNIDFSGILRPTQYFRSMLQQLCIRNYAIIEQLSIEFGNGMNIITGETGAGKSILVGALGLVLGDRADTSVLLEKEKKCVVEARFLPPNKEVLSALFQQHDLDPADEIIIRREVSSNGKSRSFINDTPVNLPVLRLFAETMVDLHRQFDTQEIGASDFQLNVVDALAGSGPLLQHYQVQFQAYTKASTQYQSLLQKQQQSSRELDYNQFLFDELAEAGLRENELETLEQELEVLNHAEEIKQVLTAAVHQLSAGDQPLVQQLKSINQQLEGLKTQPAGLAELVERMQSAVVELRDIADDLLSTSDKVHHDDQRLAWVSARLDEGNRLLKKHGVTTTAELLQIQAQLDDALQKVSRLDEDIARLKAETDSAFSDLLATGHKLREARRKIIGRLEKETDKLLQQVGMPNASLKAELQPLEKPSPNGTEEIRFLFDANKSGRFEPLQKVASGGELSRLMLSIKSLVAAQMQLPTLIFDEIDSGISGEAARQVGIIMQSLAGHHQLIAITHQPQIAARANQHYYVYKQEVNGKVQTGVQLLETDERVATIARMLSGNQLTDAAERIAREMMDAFK